MIYSKLDIVERSIIKNACVIMIGIGIYDGGGAMGDLIGVSNDYKNMIKLFVHHFMYSFIYETDDNKMVVLNKSKLIKNNNKYLTNFKLYWIYDEIKTFVINCKKIISKIKPDSLIFIISSHGDSDNIIYTSDFDEYQLIAILAQFWNTKNGCPFLANKPKLFVLDMCQGQKTPLPKNEIIKNSDESLHLKGKNESNKAGAVDKSESKKTSPMIDDTRLDYENFCIIYGNLEGYAVVDGGIEGGYLIRGLKNVLKQKNIGIVELNQIIQNIRKETLRLVKGENKKWKNNYKPSENNARQIIECRTNMENMVYFGGINNHTNELQNITNNTFNSNSNSNNSTPINTGHTNQNMMFYNNSVVPNNMQPFPIHPQMQPMAYRMISPPLNQMNMINMMHPINPVMSAPKYAKQIAPQNF